MSDVAVYEPDDAALDKARLVLNGLRDSALKPPFDLDSGNPEEVWAAVLMPYAAEPILAALGQWVSTETEFPTVAEFTTLVGYMAKELADELREEVDLCSECEGELWLTEWGAEVEVEAFASKQLHTRKFTQPDDGDPENRTFVPAYPNRHARPCQRCLPEAFELYRTGHFSKGHRPCPLCRDYTPEAIARRARRR